LLLSKGGQQNHEAGSVGSGFRVFFVGTPSIDSLDPSPRFASGVGKNRVVKLLEAVKPGKECAVLMTLATTGWCYLFRDEIVRSGTERSV
jgi:hypothetical protein